LTRNAGSHGSRIKSGITTPCAVIAGLTRNPGSPNFMDAGSSPA
jgi:hypothetical protein